jgi:hypothetical protein
MSLEPGDGALHFFIRGLRVSRLLDLREVCGPKTVKPSYSNGQEKTRKTEIGASEPQSHRGPRSQVRRQKAEIASQGFQFQDPLRFRIPTISDPGIRESGIQGPSDHKILSTSETLLTRLTCASPIMLGSLSGTTSPSNAPRRSDL